ncbi:MAG TPA: NF038122 family metalloprotease [Thermoanaerobaculia bacterium]|nr:NF038122 family metalloprotease [Thermoanaerobaculia bacterium]
MNSRNALVRFPAVLAVFFVALVASAQEPALYEALQHPLHTQGAYVVREVAGSVSCLDATSEEALRINARPEVAMHVFGESRDRVRANAGGLNIILRGTSQLDANPDAKAAFERAAQIWEARIANPVTVYVDVDFGSTRFGEAWSDENIIASASSDYRGGVDGLYSAIRPLLVARADNATETAVYAALPGSTLPTNLGSTTRVASPSILFRAIGALPATATTRDSGPNIGFNSRFSYDFNPNDGISPGKKDFEGVVVHEIGHMLGFVSLVGVSENNSGTQFIPTILDFFRFRPGVTAGTFGTAQRVQSSGGEQVFFANGATLAFSTGRPDGTGGDEQQASHWKDDALSGTRIGIMDPTLSSGARSELTANDLGAFAMIGYNVISGTTPVTTIPNAPTNLTATATSSSVIRLTWTDNSSDETEFRIEQKVNGSFVDIGKADPNATAVNVTDFSPSSTATFRVRARNSAGSSAYTNEATATTFGTGGPTTCTANANVVCLLNNRFRVSIDYTNVFANPPQPGKFLGGKFIPGVQNPDVATFGISSAQAIEAVVRIQDARPFANRFDIYYGGLTDLPYTVTVTDTQTGATRNYNNVAGTVGGGVDRTSFPAAMAGFEYITSGGYDSFVAEASLHAAPSEVVYFATPVRKQKSSNAPVEELRAEGLSVVPHRIGGGGACSEVEPNQNTAQASNLPLNDPCTGFVDLLNTGALNVNFTGGGSDNIEDVFKVTLPGSAKLNVVLNFTSSASDLDFYIFSSALEIVGSSNGDTTTESTTTNTLPAGTYYVGVSAYTGQSNYTVTASAVGLAQAPSAPTNLTATAVSSTQIGLSWTDNSNNETGFIIEARVGNSGFAPVGDVVPANTTSVTVTGAQPGVTYIFRVKARNASGDSGYSNEASATPSNGGPSTCSASSTVACLQNGRFRVSIAFINAFANPPQPGNFLGAKLVPGSQNPDVATFGISSAQAIEVVVRIQDARPFANRFDIYYGGLTDLEYTVTVTDVQSGVTRTYRNSFGSVGGGVDRSSFTP